MQLDELVLEWIQKAKQDIMSARFLVDMKPRPIEIIGYHAQQAVEKSLKAILVQAGFTPPRTHDLVFLHNLCTQDAGSDLHQIELCARLSLYAVNHRYPGESFISETELLEDLKDAEAFCGLVSRLLS